jgi:hypothetical protein
MLREELWKVKSMWSEAAEEAQFLPRMKKAFHANELLSDMRL